MLISKNAQIEKILKFKENNDLNLKGEIVTDCEPLINTIIYRKFRYPHLYEDLTSEAKIAILQAIDDYSEKRGAFTTLCYIYIKNRLINFLKRNHFARDSVNPLFENEIPINIVSESGENSYSQTIEQLNDIISRLEVAEQKLALEYLGFKNFPEYVQPKRQKMKHTELRKLAVKKIIKMFKEEKFGVINNEADT